MPKSDLDRYIRSATFEPERHFIPSSLPTIQTLIDNKQGFQSGRFLELVGDYSTGKTTLALDLLANAQRLGHKCAYADVERTFDRRYADVLGVDTSALDMIYADTAENNLAVVETLARRGYGLIVIDSIPALVPSLVVEDDPTEGSVKDIDYTKPKKMAALGTLLTDWVRRMVPIIDYHNTLVICINQYRANFSTMSRQNKKPYGPWIYNHALTWRLELARIENEEDTATVQCKVSKNKLGKERGIGKYQIVYGAGLNVKEDILRNAVQANIVTRKGAWYYHKDISAQGEQKAFSAFDFTRMKEELYAVA